MILSRKLSNNPMGVGFSQGNKCMLVDRFAISLIIGEQKIVQNKFKSNLLLLNQFFINQLAHQARNILLLLVLLLVWQNILCRL